MKKLQISEYAKKIEGKLTKFEIADYLDNKEVIAEYLNEVASLSRCQNNTSQNMIITTPPIPKTSILFPTIRKNIL
jgi:hypothetical protein